MRTPSTHRRQSPISHGTIQRPCSAHRGSARLTSQQMRPIRRPNGEWSKGPDMSIKVSGLRDSETTWNLMRNFKIFGQIVYIEIHEGIDGKRKGFAKIQFSPPPAMELWGKQEMRSPDSAESYLVHVDTWFAGKDSDRNVVRSPLRPHVTYEPKMAFWPSTLHIGIMIDKNCMMPFQNIVPQKPADLRFIVDLHRKQITVEVKVVIQDPRYNAKAAGILRGEAGVGAYNRVNDYRFQIPFAQLKTLSQFSFNDQRFGLAVSLDSPPQYFRKRENEASTHSPENLTWNDWDLWYRQTDIVYDPFRLMNEVVSLHKEQPVIDIGRWNTYLFVFERAQNSNETFEKMKQALADYNITVVAREPIDRKHPNEAELWSLIDPPQREHDVSDMQALDQYQWPIALPFEVRYQLEVCISRGIINEHNISKPFIQKLSEIASGDPSKARNILEYIVERSGRVFKPMEIFEDNEAICFSPKTAIPPYCAYARKATVTPSTIYYSSPTVETTNRVLRRYARENSEGRFLRVQFTDELLEGRINSSADKQRNDEIYTRVYRTLFNGIRIGERHYEFLAFGNSQFRENGAYFFCPTEHLSCADIRDWMGNFSHIKVTAKYAARLGQCFSTTRAINGLSKPDIVRIPDIKTGEFCFTDGVGKISAFLAQMIAAELGIRSSVAPSAFQFRLGGCKGILVVSQDAKEKEVHVRESQQKFTATYNGLEIIRCSRYSCATLNRQTIAILSALGVSDDIFLKMMSEQLTNYQNAIENDELAVSLLLRYIDDTQMTINIATMIRNGFMAQREPFVMSLLHLWRSWSIKLLKEKAKIIVEKGVFVLGCVDESATLRGHNPVTVPYGDHYPAGELPQIFLQVPDKDDPSRYIVVEGICLVGRNPSLHPGDLRVVLAIDVPALHHLRDVVVFPANGEQDIPSMCSGGDLDGDDYFVIWDEHLMPREWNAEPMNYKGPAPRQETRPVQVMDLMKFFVRFMKNDALPTIAHAHLAQADQLVQGVKDPICLELAALHSKAVDYVKTGQEAKMPKRLKPKKWPHFMEKKHLPKDRIYHSNSILGQLYDKVETVDFFPQWKEPFDKRILSAYKLETALLKTCRQTKSQYDTAMRRILAQQEIKTEFEVWSTFVLSRPRVGSDYKQQEEMARISETLKEQFRAICIDRAGGKDFQVLGPFVAGMYKVTKEELDIALAECKTLKLVGGREEPKRRMEPKYMPLITFPWLFEKELGRIATGVETTDEVDDLGLQSLMLDKTKSRRRGGGDEIIKEDFIQQEDGVIVHRGEELDLFRSSIGSDDLPQSSDLEYLGPGDQPSHFLRELREPVLTTAFPDMLTGPFSGTGVEEVVPSTSLDGFINSRPADHIKIKNDLDEYWPLSIKPHSTDSPLPYNLSNKSSESSAYVISALGEPYITGRGLSPTSHTPDLISDTFPAPEDKPEGTQDVNLEEVVMVKPRESALEKLSRGGYLN